MPSCSDCQHLYSPPEGLVASRPLCTAPQLKSHLSFPAWEIQGKKMWWLDADPVRQFRSACGDHAGWFSPSEPTQANLAFGMEDVTGEG